MHHSQERKIISVGGSIVIPKTGFDIEFLKKFRALILKHVEAGMQAVLIIGGGATARMYQQAAKSVVPIEQVDLDWIGIGATVFNAKFMQKLFQECSYEEVVTNPTKKIRTRAPLIIAAGWQPGCSTDTDAVLFAKRYKAKTVINLSNIEQVYDKDPALHPDAQAIASIDWARFRKEIVGDVWEPGKSAPFDPVASKLAEQLRLTVSILKGTELDQVDHVLSGEEFHGTVIHP